MIMQREFGDTFQVGEIPQMSDDYNLEDESSDFENIIGDNENYREVERRIQEAENIDFDDLKDLEIE